MKHILIDKLLPRLEKNTPLISNYPELNKGHCYRQIDALYISSIPREYDKLHGEILSGKSKNVTEDIQCTLM